MLTLTPETLAGMIDQTLLKPYVTHDDFIRFCAESAEYGFKTIAISSAMVTRCRKWLGNSPVGITAVAGFPLGQMTIAAKVYESIAAIEDGANEIDYVVNMVALKSGEFSLVEEEMCAITEACHARGAGCKVIFENCYLTDEEKRILCDIALRARPDFIKTSTGFGTGNATLADVKLMKTAVGDAVKVKAAGGIRCLDDAIAMIEAGAERLGTSAGLQLVKELIAR